MFRASPSNFSLAANALLPKVNVTHVTLTCVPDTLTKVEKGYQIPERRFHLAIPVRDDKVPDDFQVMESKTLTTHRLTAIYRTFLANKENAMSRLEDELKQLIIDSLDLEDINVDEIDSQEALFNEGLGLDSIDALELGLAIRKKYNIRIDAEKDDVVRIFASVAALAKFIESERH